MDSSYQKTYKQTFHLWFLHHWSQRYANHGDFLRWWPSWTPPWIFQITWWWEFHTTLDSIIYQSRINYQQRKKTITTGAGLGQKSCFCYQTSSNVIHVSLGLYRRPCITLTISLGPVVNSAVFCDFNSHLIVLILFIVGVYLHRWIWTWSHATCCSTKNLEGESRTICRNMEFVTCCWCHQQHRATIHALYSTHLIFNPSQDTLEA